LLSWFRAQGRPTPLPEGVRVYAIGDIHGCTSQLDRLTSSIVEDANSAKGVCHLVYLGDYVDRGPDSKGVVDRILHPPGGFQVQAIRGNHDQSVLDFLKDPSMFSTWKPFGAQETLVSYGVMPPRFDNPAAFVQARDQLAEKMPAAHLNFFQNLPFSAQIGGYFFAHAGVRPGVPLDRQVPEDLLWIRDEFLLSGTNFGKIVVHGHTPTPMPLRRRNRIGVDTGAYATGKLTAAVLEGAGCRFLQT
jgi:serine/threonine protein phosphatase 1